MTGQGAATDSTAVNRQWIETAAAGIETLAVLIIAGAIVYATVFYLVRVLRHLPAGRAYEDYRERVGRALLLGLEVLVAADIVRTVVLEPTFDNVAILGLLVLIRTFLSWSLVVEVEGRWPWQARPGVRTSDQEVEEGSSD